MFTIVNQLVEFELNENTIINENGQIVWSDSCTETQTLYSDIYAPNETGIENVKVNCSEDCLFAVSWDKGTTWMAHDGTEWITLAGESSGMNAGDFESVSLEDWASVLGESYMVRLILPNAESYFESFTVNYIL